jgi:hypothetical protein
MQAQALRAGRRRVSNHAKNLRMIDGVDGRSQSARRDRDLVDAILGEFGGTADPIAVRELAGLRLSIEITQCALVHGDRHARNDLVRLTNLANRAQRAMREAKRAAPATAPTTTLQERLAAKYAAKGGPS